MSFRIEIEQKVFSSSLNRLQGLLERRDVMPILSFVKLDVREGLAYMTATNMEMSLEEKLECSLLEGEGVVTLPGFMLHRIVGSLPADGTIHMALDKDENDGLKTIISCGRARFNLRSLHDSYPPITKSEDGKKISLKSEDFLRLLTSIDHAIPKAVARASLNGIYIHGAETSDNKSVFSMVATDGHRMAISSFPMDGIGGMDGIIVPSRAVKEIKNLLSDRDGDIILRLSEKNMVLECGSSWFQTRLLDENYPDYRSILPKDDGIALSISSADLLANAVSRVSMVGDDKDNRIVLKIENNVLTMTARNSDFHEGMDELDVDYGEDSLEVGYNASYLHDTISVLRGGKITLKVRGVSRPTTVLGDKNPDYLGLLMPVRT